MDRSHELEKLVYVSATGSAETTAQKSNILLQSSMRDLSPTYSFVMNIIRRNLSVR